MKKISKGEKYNLIRLYLMTRAKEDLIAQIVYPHLKKNFTTLYRDAVNYIASGGLL
jgi:hypothetical protein